MSIYINILGLLRANNYRLFFLLICTISAASISFAYFVEYIWGFPPCILCLYQRIPYFALFLISIAGLFIGYKRCFLMLIILTCLSSVILAVYHTGVERRIFSPTETCSAGEFISDNLSNEELLEKLYAAPIADCSKPAFKIFGFSMTEWNLLLSVVLLVFCVRLCFYSHPGASSL